MRNEDFALSLFSVIGMAEAVTLAESNRVHASVSDDPFGTDDTIDIELSIADQNFRIIMGGLDLAYDQRPLTVNQASIDDHGAKGVACMLIESYLYDYRAYQASATA